MERVVHRGVRLLSPAVAKRLSQPSPRSTCDTPAAVSCDVPALAVDGEVTPGDELTGDAVGVDGDSRRSSLPPAITSGMRASSMRIESASSITADENGRWTRSAGSITRPSRR